MLPVWSKVPAIGSCPFRPRLTVVVLLEIVLRAAGHVVRPVRLAREVVVVVTEGLRPEVVLSLFSDVLLEPAVVAVVPVLLGLVVVLVPDRAGLLGLALVGRLLSISFSIVI